MSAADASPPTRLDAAAPAAAAAPARRTRIDARPGDATADAAELRRKADQVARGAARAAVLGVNDGLVTTLALILGLAGADASVSSVRLAGFASLVAGALSMAAGEWVSVRAQVELFQGVLAELRSLLARNPKVVLDAMEERLEEFGFDTSTDRKASTEVGLDEDLLLSFAARNVFGVNDDELGSPVTAAVSSLLLFSLGGAVPLVPWFFTQGAAGVAWTVSLTTLSAIGVGAYIGRSGGTSILRAATRQFVIVALASGVTYGIGALFGTTVG